MALLQARQKPVAAGLDDLRPRIVVFVNPVAESHRRFPPSWISRPQELRAVVSLMPDMAEHLENRLIGTAMERFPQSAQTPGRCAGKDVRPAGGNHAAPSRSEPVLLMIRVEKENLVEQRRRLPAGGSIV